MSDGGPLHPLRRCPGRGRAGYMAGSTRVRGARRRARRLRRVPLVVHRAAIEHREAGRRSLKCIQDMEARAGANSNTMKDHFHETFRWMGNRGCGTKMNLQEFRENWQLRRSARRSPSAAYKTEKFLVDGNWAACFGKIEGTHSGEFMGIPATGRRVTVPYMDFWLIEDAADQGQLGQRRLRADGVRARWDVFDGKGWEAYDSKQKVAPRSPPAEKRAPPAARAANAACARARLGGAHATTRARVHTIMIDTPW